jgi:DNA-binding MarR family transcriptional regulator
MSSYLHEQAKRFVRDNPSYAREIARVVAGYRHSEVGLTRRQADALRFIEKYQSDHGFAPSYAEICKALGLESKSGIHRIVSALEDRGYVARLPGRVRTIKVLRAA